MTERDTYPDEEPTRPDLPAFMRPPACRHCGRPYGEHAELFPLDLEAECMGLRDRFAPEAAL